MAILHKKKAILSKAVSAAEHEKKESKKHELGEETGKIPEEKGYTEDESKESASVIGKFKNLKKFAKK